MTAPLATIESLNEQAASLLLYQQVLQQDVGAAYLVLLRALRVGESVACLEAYGYWFRAIAATGQSWPAYLAQQIIWDDNPFSQQAQRCDFAELSPALIAAAESDLQALQALAACGGEQLAAWVQAAADPPAQLATWRADSQLPAPFAGVEPWGEAVAELAACYRQQGSGLVARYRALRWQAGELVGIAHPDPIEWAEIVGYAEQKAVLLQNTEALLDGLPALHVLLYGSRGSGKSSLVKALLNRLGDRGLRLVEVSKAQLYNLPAIVEALRDLPQKFVIFVDDLSFEEDDEAFKALKVVLEGSLTARARNVVVYATSNRRHLIREFFADRPRPSQDDEVHAWDTMQEKLSFSDRFGLALTFEPADQSRYLQIVRHLATRAGLEVPPEELDFRARQWATRHNGRSGRTARQFVDFLLAERARSRIVGAQSGNFLQNPH